MSRVKRIAIYMRLSKEDEGGDESNSIHMQRILLQAYVDEHFKGCQLMEFKDDGYSGTNFERPAVTELLNLVKSSELDCIIVKDFSRFSRDYIELGSYMEQIFPFMKVRFISINDNYDSSTQLGTTGSLDVSFKHLLYDLYSKDLSVKVKTSLASIKEGGTYVSGLCPFGYEKAQDDRHKLLVATDEAEIVKRIFALTLNGQTSTQIARLFNQEGVKTPIEYKMAKGKTKCTPKGDGFHWITSGICQILRNEFYVGDIVYGKYKRSQVGGKSQLLPRAEWKIHRNHHEPIISREDFERIQAGRGRSSGRGRRIDRIRDIDRGRGGSICGDLLSQGHDKYKHHLVGKLVCGGCRKNLIYRDTTALSYFCCCKRYETLNEKCVKKVDVMFLDEAVLYLFHQEMIRLPGIEQMKAELQEQVSCRKKENEATIKGLEKELIQLQQVKVEKYEAFTVHGDETIYQNEMADICVKENVINQKIQSCRNGFDEEKLKYDNVVRLSNPLLPFLNIRRLTQEAVDVLVSRIIVSDEGQIKVEWTFDINELCNSLT